MFITGFLTGIISTIIFLLKYKKKRTVTINSLEVYEIYYSNILSKKVNQNVN
jgi:hypothetical protein